MIEIKSYSKDFAEAVGPFVLGIQHEFGVPITLEAQPDLQNIERAYFQSGGHFWLALDNNKLIGTIAMIRCGQQTGVIRKMFVAPEYRGTSQRVGQLLLDTLLRWALAEGLRNLYLGTLEVLAAARRFYEKNGFQLFPENQLPPEVEAIKMRLDTTYYTMDLAA